MVRWGTWHPLARLACLQQQQPILKAKEIIIAGKCTQLCKPLGELGVAHLCKSGPKSVSNHAQPGVDWYAGLVRTAVHRHLDCV